MKRALLLLWTLPLCAQTAHVVVIGIDGFGAAAVRDNATPRIHELMGAGAWTLQARGVMPTVSSPNWASMIMGAGPEQHGVTSNDWQPDKFEFLPVCRGTASIFPTMFGLLRAQRPTARISIIHDWDDFARLTEPGVASLIRHTTGAAATVDAGIAEWRANQPTLLFLHIDEVDHAGHDNGWGSPEYRAMVATVDTLVGKLVDAVRATPAGAQTTFVLSADHGGVGTKHGGMSMAELEIPWVAAGAGIVKNHQITTSVNTFDTAATVAALLGLTPPDCWIGRPVRESLTIR
jgi:predicted AlkP superfamily pyrophosphatase or phosphodiesterase